MRPAALLSAVRAGDPLPPGALDAFATGLADGSVSDAQAGAFAMAVCCRGLGAAGRVALTTAMRDSGARLRWDLPGPILDKHSTGGVGDSVSLLLAPALAALGCFVPMISGRGLGHSGGTLDKLEAIPGLSTELDAPRLRRVVAEAGCAIVGASPDIAPADRRLYGVRDVTGTVDHVDLITASILSKKLAAGTDALVLDVKVGSGAFMRDIEAARTLATALVDTANGAGCPTHALITDMDQPLAPALGNALEVMAVMRTLAEGDTAAPLAQLAAELGGSLLVSASLADTPREGAVMVADVLRGGQAAERFAMMVRAMGGPGDFVERWRDRLPAAPEIRAVTAEHAGVVTAIDGRALGEAVVRMGGGRQDLGDVIDPAVGLSDVMRLGEPVDAGSVLARVHAGRPVAAEAAEAAVRAAFTVAESAPAERSRVLERPLVLERIG